MCLLSSYQKNIGCSRMKEKLKTCLNGDFIIMDMNKNFFMVKMDLLMDKEKLLL